MNFLSIKISEPQTPQEFEAYYLVRFEVLRKPWDKPVGSEKDELEEQCIHIFARNENNAVLGVCRMQFNSDHEAQLRYMAVTDAAQGKGVGKMLIQYLEKKAKSAGITIVVLHSREKAVDFYKKCGYTIVEKSYLMWNQIQHYLMKKEL